MADTTKENILLIAPHLSVLDDALFTLVIADVILQVGATYYGKKTEVAQRYLAAHVMQLTFNEGSSNIRKDKVGSVEREFDVRSILSNPTRYDTTAYGMVFWSLNRQSIPRFLTVTPDGNAS